MRLHVNHRFAVYRDGRSTGGPSGSATRAQEAAALVVAMLAERLTPLSFTIQCQPTAPKKWHAFKETKISYQIVFTHRSAPTIVPKDAWQSSSGRPTAERQQGTPTSTGNLVAEEEMPCKVDLIVQRIPQDAVLEDQGRSTTIQELKKIQQVQ